MYKPLAIPERLGAVPLDKAMALVEKNFDAIFQWTQQTVGAISASSVPPTVQGDLLVGTADGLAVLSKDPSKISYLSNRGTSSQPQWASANQGDVLVGDASGLAVIPKSATATRYFANTGVSNQPKWDQVNLANGVTGQLPALANLPNFSVTQRLWGRNSAGSGVAEEVTISQVLDWISATRGTILFRGASAWSALAPSAGGLVSGGAGTDPSWASVALGGGNLQSGAGNPQGSISAALGSMYQDTATGYFYQKLGGAATAFGWYRVPVIGAGMAAGLVAWATAVGPGSANAFGGNSFGALGAVTGSGANSPAYLVSGGRTYAQAQTTAVSGNTTALNTNSSSITKLLDDDIDLTCEFLTPADITNIRFWFGLSSATATTDTDTLGSGSTGGALCFRYSTAAGDGGWVGYTAAGGGGSTHVSATILAIAASTAYKLRVRFVRAGTPTVYFSINDGAETAMTANLPATGGSQMVVLGVCTKANVLKVLSYRSIAATIGA
jgi:hypothetical protein